MNRILPYSFKGIQKQIPVTAMKSFNVIGGKLAAVILGDGIYAQFSQIFSNVLQSFEENDQGYLKNIMEPKLFKETCICLDLLNTQKVKLKYLTTELKQESEEEELSPQQQQLMKFLGQDPFNPNNYIENDMSINLGAKGVFGVRINRKENEGKPYFLLPATQLATRFYYINLSDPLSLYRNQILQLDVIFKTSRRLIAMNENGEVMHGALEVTKPHIHRWRFESYIPTLDWTLTDIDEYLKGNSFIPKK